MDGAGARTITLTLALSDERLADRLASEIAGHADLLVVAGGPADIVVAGAVDTGDWASANVVLIGAGGSPPYPPGVRAVLPADAEPRIIIAAIRLVAAGLLVLPDDSLETGSEFADETAPVTAPIALTPREKEVLTLLAAGASNKVIARQLGVSVHTAKFHVASLLRKLGASGRLEAVGIGLRNGLLMV